MSDAPRPLAAVTGITGFIGGHLADLLARRGWRVRALARSMPKLAARGGPPVEIVPGSLADQGALARLVEGADLVIHLAGAIKARGRERYVRANVAGTQGVAEAWRAQFRDRGNMSRFILLSSLAARAPEVSHYAASKAAAEDALRGIGGDLPWIILRPGAVYGPGDRETLAVFKAACLPAQPMLNGPGARVAAIHVRDLARAILALGEDGRNGAVYELSDRNITGYSWPELSEAATDALGRTPRPFRLPAAALKALGRLGDLAGTLGASGMLTSQKAGEILHGDWGARPEMVPPAEVWVPEIDLEDGFAETVGWYRDQGWLRP